MSVPPLPLTLDPDTRVLTGPAGSVQLRGTHARMMAVFLRKPAISRDAMFHALYGHLPNPPFEKVLDVMVAAVRKVLRHVAPNVTIVTVWGQGWNMRAEPAPPGSGAPPMPVMDERLERAAATIARLSGALIQAAKVFNAYADLHRSKGTPAGLRKAAANELLALEMLRALDGGYVAPQLEVARG